MPPSSVRLALVCAGFLLSSAAIGCAGQPYRDVALDKMQEPPAAAAIKDGGGEAAKVEALRQDLHLEAEARRRGDDSTASRIVALESVHAQMVARLQQMDEKVEEDRWRGRKVALAGSTKEPQVNGMLATPSPSERKPDCAMPFFMDQRGIKKPKLECM